MENLTQSLDYLTFEMKIPLTHIHNKTDKPQADLDIPIFETPI